MTQDSSATRPWFCPRTNCPAPGEHDTYSAYSYGCRSGAARRDAQRYRKLWMLGRNEPRRTDPTGVQRRIQACHLQGWTDPRIAEELGTADRVVAQARRGEWGSIQRARRDAWVPILERMAGTPAPTSPAAGKARAQAQKKGYHPLLAWVDIDDPDEQPPTETLSEPPTLRAVDDLDLDALYVAVRERRRPLGELDARARSYVVERAWRVKLEEGYETHKLLHQTATLLNADPMLVSRTHASAVTRRNRALKEAS